MKLYQLALDLIALTPEYLMWEKISRGAVYAIPLVLVIAVVVITILVKRW